MGSFQKPERRVGTQERHTPKMDDRSEVRVLDEQARTSERSAWGKRVCSQAGPEGQWRCWLSPVTKKPDELALATWESEGGRAKT